MKPLLAQRADETLTEEDAAVWEHSRVRQLYRNTLMTDFAQAFQNDHNNISGAVQQDRSFKDIKDFFDAHGGIYSVNAFPSPIIHINPFSHKSKNTSSQRVNLFCILGVSITRF